MLHIISICGQASRNADCMPGQARPRESEGVGCVSGTDFLAEREREKKRPHSLPLWRANLWIILEANFARYYWPAVTDGGKIISRLPNQIDISQYLHLAILLISLIPSLPGPEIIKAD